jgi:hypothetical protein
MNYINNLAHKVIAFILSILEHQLIIFITSIVFLIIIPFIFPQIIEYIDVKYKQLYRYFHKIFVKWKTHNTISNMKNNDNELSNIKRDTKVNINNLRNKQRMYPGIQYLLEYPSPKGYRELIGIIVLEKNDDIRNKLLYLMYTNARNRWYGDII